MAALDAADWWVLAAAAVCYAGTLVAIQWATWTLGAATVSLLFGLRLVLSVAFSKAVLGATTITTGVQVGGAGEGVCRGGAARGGAGPGEGGQVFVGGSSLPAVRVDVNPSALSRYGLGLEDVRIAVAGGYFAEGGMPEAHAAVATVAAALGVTRSIDVPGAAQARAAAFLITASQGAALHLDNIRTRPGDFDPDVRDRLIAGAMIPAAWVTKAQKLRRQFHARMLDLFGDVDLLLAPATPCRAPRIGQKTMVLGGIEMPVRPNLGIYTQPISCIGLPVVAVPVWTDGIALPIGVQVIAPPWREDLALRAAAVLEAQGVCRAPVAR